MRDSNSGDSRSCEFAKQTREATVRLRRMERSERRTADSPTPPQGGGTPIFLFFLNIFPKNPILNL